MEELKKDLKEKIETLSTTSILVLFFLFFFPKSALTVARFLVS
jgi:hypothetical protein